MLIALFHNYIGNVIRMIRNVYSSITIKRFMTQTY